MSELLISVANRQPVLALLLGVLFVLILPLGLLHTLRIFGGYLLLTVKEFKHEIVGIREILREIWQELRR